MEYGAIRAILEEDSDEMHPNIEENTFRRWRSERKELARERLRERRKEIEKCMESREGTREELEELQRIGEMLREKIVEVFSETQINRGREEEVFHIAVAESPSGVEKRMSEIVSIITETGEVMHYLEDVFRNRGRDVEKEAEIEKEVASLIIYNVREEYFEAARRICKYSMALEYAKSARTEEIKQGLLCALEEEGARYFNSVLGAIKRG